MEMFTPQDDQRQGPTQSAFADKLGHATSNASLRQAQKQKIFRHAMKTQNK